MLNYYKPIVDNNGFTHSIDMVEILYDGIDFIDQIIDEIREMAKKWEITDYWEQLNQTPCPRYQYWDSQIHFSKIMFLKLGKYTEVFANEQGKNKKFVKVNLVLLKVNPNKYGSSYMLKEMLELLNRHCLGSRILKKVDYAIDVKAFPDDVVVMRNRKTKGLYRGTRYYGERNKHGFVRIYNKALESQLDYNLTRVETICVLNKKFSSIEFGVVQKRQADEDEKVNVSTELLVDMLQELQMLGSDNVDKYLGKMNYRTRKKVMEKLYGNIITYEPNTDILNQLLDNINELFDSQTDELEENRGIKVDDDGFMIVDDEDGLPLPWEI